jgi:hypothetical protein
MITELWKWRQVYVMSSVLSFWFIPKEKNAIIQYQKKKFCFGELEKPKKGEGCVEERSRNGIKELPKLETCVVAV